MAKKTFKVEDIINKLREAEVLKSQGKTVSEICRSLAISDPDLLPGGKSTAEWGPNRPNG